MKALKFLFIILFVLCTSSIFGQIKKKSYVSTAINYISDAVFMGRKDSIAAPYLYPSIAYHHKSGFYGKGSFSYLTQPDESRIDLYLFTAGFDFKKNKLSGDFSATKYFFNNASYNVISEVTADISASLSYDFKILNLTVNASNYLSNNENSDLFLSSEISHDFLTSNNKFQISPTAGIYLGSQNFYDAYYINSRIRDRKNNDPENTTQTVIETVIEESESFNLMAIEVSLPMWYSKNSITASFLPVLVFPQHEASILNDDTVVKEELENVFYWMVGLSYRFK
ncbi:MULTISPECIES: hypothetical protein [Flavobacteriaceae]|uniref:MipA/OmpV family protein n=2 Tax=Flavobacteriaceae TaxID=49546 RepID=A0A4Y8AVX7_9FLAO|nr:MULTISPECIES: hypothetical protein [Flavobacteriaceae]TEW75506.1 hypothetical protein E2488_08345 [Gramella jeungdoensis]GGK45781.1 hypothetical protein GCM10007963_12550 [Lutibacter litoralis]